MSEDGWRGLYGYGGPPDGIRGTGGGRPTGGCAEHTSAPGQRTAVAEYSCRLFTEPSPGRNPGPDHGSTPTVTSETPGTEEREKPADIPVVILCGGMGTRLREASEKLPKPMVDIGGRPILWHIMKTYGHYGFRRFVLCLGYKSSEIKNYFLEYRELVADFTLRLSDDHTPTFHNCAGDEDWEVTFAETGLLTGTGARLRRVRDYLTGPRFMLTYGDGVGSIDVAKLLETHTAAGRVGTVTGVRPSSRYGELATTGDAVRQFAEKPPQTGWVSGGYFVFEREFIDKYLDDDPGLLLERHPLQQLARDGQLSLNPHEGFWMGMDTFRDWTELNQLWDAGQAPWRVWKN